RPCGGAQGWRAERAPAGLEAAGRARTARGIADPARYPLPRSVPAAQTAHRPGTDYIDLDQLHNARIEPVLDDDLWAELEALRTEGKVRELGVALGPAIGWVEEGVPAVDARPIGSLQTVFNVIEQDPGLTFARRARVADGECG